MNDQGRKNVQRRPPASIDAERLMVHFAPEVVRSFARLEAVVNESEHFDPDLLANLQNFAAGKSCSVQTALTEMALIAREAMKTRDSRAEEALDELIKNLMGMQRDSKPVTIVQASRTRTL